MNSIKELVVLSSIYFLFNPPVLADEAITGNKNDTSLVNKTANIVVQQPDSLLSLENISAMGESYNADFKIYNVRGNMQISLLVENKQESKTTEYFYNGSNSNPLSKKTWNGGPNNLQRAHSSIESTNDFDNLLCGKILNEFLTKYSK